MAAPIRPDLSLITKSRPGWYGTFNQLFNGIGGPEYVYSVLTGYEEPPGRTGQPRQPEGKSYNPYFAAGHWIGMPAPLTDDQVTYDDGTPATVDQMARTCRPSWPGRPSPRWKSARALGFMVMIYLGDPGPAALSREEAIWGERALNQHIGLTKGPDLSGPFRLLWVSGIVGWAQE